MAAKAKLALLFKEAKSKPLQPSVIQPTNSTIKGKKKKPKKSTENNISQTVTPLEKSTTETETHSNTQTDTVTRTTKHSTDRQIHPTTNKQKTHHQDDPRNLRTLFIGNLPLTVTKKDILRLVSPFGTVESMRQRSAAVSPGKLPVAIARKLGKQIAGTSVNYYIVMTTEDSAKACLELNGRDVSGRHIRVDLATPTNDTRNSVFVGNVPFNAEEEQLRKLFESCGAVDNVRIIRDGRTGINKGFSYVKFKDRSGVFFACKQNEKIELDGRKLRVFRCRSDKVKGQTKFGGTKSQLGRSSRLVKSVQPGFGKKRKGGGGGKERKGGRKEERGRKEDKGKRKGSFQKKNFSSKKK